MHRRSLLRTVASSAIATAAGMSFVPRVVSEHRSKQSATWQKLQAVLDSAQDGAMYDPYIFKSVSKDGLMRMPNPSCIESFEESFWLNYSDGFRSLDEAAANVLCDTARVTEQYSKAFKGYERRAIHGLLQSIRAPESTRHELQAVLDSLEQYRIVETYQQQDDPLLPDKEIAYTIKHEHRPAIHFHPPRVQFIEESDRDVENELWSCVWITMRASVDGGPRVRQHMRKHTGVHQISGPANVQWKDPGNVPADDPLRRTTIGPCACCK